MFFVVIKATRRLPAPAIWGVAALLESAQVQTGWTVIDEFCARFVYIYTGYLFAAKVFALSDRARARPTLALAALVIWAVLDGSLVYFDFRGALVTLTHDPKLDDPALVAALDSQAFYIGSLGSRRTHAARLARLKQLGHTDAALARIHGPVGLAIGATTPEEIALSIVAQITQCLRAAPSESAAR